jgi:hypothetical protein
MREGECSFRLRLCYCHFCILHGTGTGILTHASRVLHASWQLITSECGMGVGNLKGWVERAFHELAYLLPALDTGSQVVCWILVTGYCAMCVGFWIPDSGFWVTVSLVTKKF